MIITAEGPKSNPAGQSRGRDSRHAQVQSTASSNAIAGRLMLTARIDVTRMLIFSERHPRSVLADYAGTATDDDPWQPPT